jgi:phosphorylase/glycogen(starch) synthase
MKLPDDVFEVSWEVCNKVGGIHTVVATKARGLGARLTGDHLLIGPWLLSHDGGPTDFVPEAGHEDFVAACEAAGIPARVGRWAIPGRPQVVLIQFSGLFERKDAVLAELWERFRVDSLTGAWDYLEPVMFGRAAGEVIRIWHRMHGGPAGRGAVAQFHEWMTASGLLYLKEHAPEIGTVFTTHATMLGRSIAGTGSTPLEGLGARSPEQAAADFGVRAKHSLESVAARDADAFTTVSGITAREATALLGRAPDPVTPNGMDLAVLDAHAAGVDAAGARAALERVAARFLGAPVAGAAFAAISGRYEFHNKGIDLLLDAVAELRGRPGRPLVLFVLVPAGSTGLRHSVRERLHRGAPADGPIGHCTHRLNDPDHDPVLRRLNELGIHNAPADRVRVIQIPVYLAPGDEVFDLPYEAVLGGFDFTVFPSFYEPWGYTPVESIGRGVPTITSDHAGFGRWLLDHELAADGVAEVLLRDGRDDAIALVDLVAKLERLLAAPADPARTQRCRALAEEVAWEKLLPLQERALAQAYAAARERVPAGGRRPVLAALPLATGGAAGPRLERLEVTSPMVSDSAELLLLARGFWWTWHPDARRLFAQIDPALWEEVGHHPLRMLARLDPQRWAEHLARHPDLRASIQRVLAQREADLAAEPPPAIAQHLDAAHPVAYFSAEFAVHESLPVYSGGLGVLAGDHLKSASDLRLPMVGIGLMYGRGYLRQRFSPSGEQLAEDVIYEPSGLALELVRGADGAALEFALPLPGSEVRVRAWLARIGRTRLYLLDTDHAGNDPHSRSITQHLYGGDSEMRLRQEIVLGRGGVRLLHALGLAPAVWHLNEGHAAFVGLERLRQLLPEHGLSFAEGRLLVRANTVFTTHTPVPAGHDAFDENLMRRYFGDAPEWLGISWEEFLALGRAPGSDGPFNMTFLACRLSGWRNGVSAMHGVVSRDLLHPLWPGLLRDEVPVQSVTNGVHLGTWAAGPVARLLMPPSAVRVSPQDYRERAATLEDAALWEARQECRRRLLRAARRNLERAFVGRGDSPRLLETTLRGLDEHALLVGFARRFAPYKRAHLLFHDLDRLAALVNHSERPVRFLFAGKAHPRDGRGQEYLKRVFQVARDPRFAGRVILLENYEMDLGRALTAGVDVWLNTPIRTMEASGTSGMKAAASGALNLSVPDGWWPEGCDGRNGWLIGGARVYREQEQQDELDATALYALLEDEIAPAFFDRDGRGVPRGWLDRVRHSLASLAPVFNSDRMVGEYRDRAYLPGAQAAVQLARQNHAAVRKQAARLAELRREFPRLRVVAVRSGDLRAARLGEAVPVEAEVALGALRAEDVEVELVLGLSSKHGASAPEVVRLAAQGAAPGGATLFGASWMPTHPGAWGYGVRVRCAGVPAELAAAELTLWA